MIILFATLVLCAATWFVYAPALSGSWLWDDPTEILNNPLLRLPAMQALPRIWQADPTQQDYLPVKTTVQWLQWHLWGDHVAGYHATNISLHVLSALLLWRILIRLGAARFASYLSALAFALHPMAVLSVAWMSELKNTLSLPLLLGSFLCYLPADQQWKRRGRRFYHERGAISASVALFAAAALAKPSVLPYPAFLLLYHWWRPPSQSTKPRALATIPFFIVAAALSVITVQMQSHRVMAPLHVLPAPFPHRLFSAAASACFYFRHAVWPFPLLPIHPPPHHWLLSWCCLLALLTAALITAIRTRNRTPFLLTAAATCFLLPVINVVPLAFARIAPVSEHLGYITLLILCASIAALATGYPRLLLPCAALPFSLLLASRSYAQHFKSEAGLWTYTLAQNPSAWLAHNNLGIALAESGQLDAAIDHFRAALAIDPSLELTQKNLERAKISLRVAHNNRGTALARADRFPEAIAEFRAAIAADPSNPGVHRNLATALHAAGRDLEAWRELETANQLTTQLR